MALAGILLDVEMATFPETRVVGRTEVLRLAGGGREKSNAERDLVVPEGEFRGKITPADIPRQDPWLNGEWIAKCLSDESRLYNRAKAKQVPPPVARPGLRKEASAGARSTGQQ
ncbi:hypothetical protein KM043_013215 [Ampulex compressa]|nr:hypothetical protein KM043_013215 [Ampulex compressa]